MKGAFHELVNRVKEKIRRGEPTVGHWLSLASPQIAEILASHTIDWLTVDTEHGAADYETVENMLRAMRGTGILPIIRVADNDAVLIKRALDRGAYGILVPMVNTAEEAAAAVAAAKYPPQGIRGISANRVNGYGRDLQAYFESWNDEVLVVLQIETMRGLENVEEIAAVPGVDVLFIGPNDLSAALGLFQQYERPEFKQAVARIFGAARRNGIGAGYMCGGSESVLAKVDEGFTFIAAGSDARLVEGAAASTYRAIRQGLVARGHGGA